MAEQRQGVWRAVNERLPDRKGAYWCRFNRPGFSEAGTAQQLEQKKMFYPSASGGTWMGGMRPFSEHDQVTHWLDEKPD